jgi:hypothetical protein
MKPQSNVRVEDLRPMALRGDARCQWLRIPLSHAEFWLAHGGEIRSENTRISANSVYLACEGEDEASVRQSDAGRALVALRDSLAEYQYFEHFDRQLCDGVSSIWRNPAFTPARLAFALAMQRTDVCNVMDSMYGHVQAKRVKRAGRQRDRVKFYAGEDLVYLGPVNLMLERVL